MHLLYTLLACLLFLTLARKTAAAPVGPGGTGLGREGNSAQETATSAREALGGPRSPPLAESEIAEQQPPAVATIALQTAPLTRRGIINIKAAHASTTITVAANVPTDKAIPNPKDQHGRWPHGVKVVPIWTLNSTTIFGVKPTHPGRPTDWPPTGQPNPTPAA